MAAICVNMAVPASRNTEPLWLEPSATYTLVLGMVVPNSCQLAQGKGSRC
jgi:hypothetical protein